MRRFRMSTLMLLIAIAALSMALLVQHHRATRREAEMRARLAQSWPLFLEKQRIEKQIEHLAKLRDLLYRQVGQSE